MGAVLTKDSKNDFLDDNIWIAFLRSQSALNNRSEQQFRK